MASIQLNSIDYMKEFDLCDLKQREFLLRCLLEISSYDVIDAAY